MLGAGAPAERFGRSHPSRQIGPSRAVGSLSNQIVVFLSRARTGKGTRLAARLRRPPHAPTLSSPRPLAAPAARRGRPALRDSARPDRSLPPLLVGVPWMQLRLTDDWFQQKHRDAPW